MSNVLKLNNIRFDFNSILLAALISSNLIANTLSMYVTVTNIFAIIIVVLAVLSLLTTGLIVNKKVLVLLCLIILQFIFSFFAIDSTATRTFLISFVVTALPSMIIASKPFDIHQTIKTVQLIGICCITYLWYVINTKFSIYESGSLMGIGYAILPLFISSVIVLFQKYNIKWTILAMVNLFFVFAASAQLISRGFFVSAVCSLIILTYYKIKNRPMRTIRLAIIVIIIAIPLTMSLLDNILASQLYHNLFEIKEADVLNGRLNDFQNITNYRPLHEILVGSGIGSYSNNYGPMYIHNVIGMVFYEMGILTALALIVIIAKSIKIMIYTENSAVQLTIAFLVCTSLIKLMVSYSLWYDHIFWIYITVMICKYNKKLYYTNNFDGALKV